MEMNGHDPILNMSNIQGARDIFTLTRINKLLATYDCVLMNFRRPTVEVRGVSSSSDVREAIVEVQ